VRRICIMSGKKEPRILELNLRITHVGRSAINDVQIKDKYVSREHVLLRKFGDKLFVMDLRSENGTFLNGVQIRSGAEVELKEGDSIVVGMSVICLEENGSDEVLPIIRSAYSSKKRGDQDKLVAENSGI
jgi:pSer/pThr/pTyr-binding forkhead associated (FHA) protein